MTTHQWPSREEWAKDVRTIYLGDECPSRYLDAYAHLVPAALRDAARVELQAFWRALAPYVRGYRTDEDASRTRHVRGLVKEFLIDESDTGFLLHSRLEWLSDTIRTSHPLPAFHRYRDAIHAQRVAAEADWQRDVEKRPIDDAAWARELKRRERIDHYDPMDHASWKARAS